MSLRFCFQSVYFAFFNLSNDSNYQEPSYALGSFLVFFSFLFLFYKSKTIEQARIILVNAFSRVLSFHPLLFYRSLTLHCYSNKMGNLSSILIMVLDQLFALASRHECATPDANPAAASPYNDCQMFCTYQKGQHYIVYYCR